MKVVHISTMEILDSIMGRGVGRGVINVNAKEINRALSSFEFSSRIETGVELTGVKKKKKCTCCHCLGVLIPNLKLLWGVSENPQPPPHPSTTSARVISSSHFGWIVPSASHS